MITHIHRYTQTYGIRLSLENYRKTPASLIKNESHVFVSWCYSWEPSKIILNPSWFSQINPMMFPAPYVLFLVNFRPNSEKTKLTFNRNLRLVIISSILLYCLCVCLFCFILFVVVLSYVNTKGDLQNVIINILLVTTLKVQWNIKVK